MAKKMYQDYLEQYLLEIQTSVGTKIGSALFGSSPLTLVYKGIRAATSKCYRKCFGSHIFWTSALCQDKCKLEECYEKITAVKNAMRQCPDNDCKKIYGEKLSKLNSRVIMLKQRIHTAEAKGKSTGFAR